MRVIPKFAANGQAIIVVLAMSLGVGCFIATFCLRHAVVSASLPFANARELVEVRVRPPNSPPVSSGTREAIRGATPEDGPGGTRGGKA